MTTVVTWAPSGKWEPVIWTRPAMSVGIGSTNEIEVFELRNGDDVYLRPIRPYFNAEFEALFQFGIGCMDYDEKKIRRSRIRAWS